MPNSKLIKEVNGNTDETTTFIFKLHSNIHTGQTK